MSEGSLWDNMRSRFSPYGLLRRCEHAQEKGWPDVYWVLLRVPGWTELKYLPDYPAMADSPVWHEHLTLEQVNWIEDEVEAGGRAYLLLQVRHDYYLFDAVGTRAIYERRVTRGDLPRVALCHGTQLTPRFIRCMISAPTIST